MAPACAVAVSLHVLPVCSSVSEDRDSSGCFSSPHNQSEAAMVTPHQKLWLSGDYWSVCVKWVWFQPSCWRRSRDFMKPTTPSGMLGVSWCRPKPTIERKGAPDSSKTIGPLWSWHFSAMGARLLVWFGGAAGRIPEARSSAPQGRRWALLCCGLLDAQLRITVLIPSGGHQMGTIRCLRGRPIKVITETSTHK